MSRSAKNNLKSLLKYFPVLDQYLYKQVHKRRFKTELELIQGIHENTNKHASIIHFSFNKAATQYVSSILRKCAVENGMTPVGLNEYAFNIDFPFLDHLSAEDMQQYKHVFKSEGYLYSVFGGMVEGVPNLEKYKIVLSTRDPRDILVSSYYSVAYSHPVPRTSGRKQDTFVSKRSVARESTIDDYVLSECDKVYDIFSRYKELLLDKYENVFMTTYEQMVSDFESWLTNLVAYCELELSQEFTQSLLKENEANKPKEEDATQHNRKGQPGDYQEKLQPETIETLNETFKPILERYRYT